MARLARIAAGILLLGLTDSGLTQAAECSYPERVADLGHPLLGMSSHLKAGGQPVIVTLGSSSTSGAGASNPEATYPARLRERLSSLLGRPMAVVNRGRNGDLIGNMLARIRTEVIPERPDVVVWQVGTNAVLTDLEPKAVGSLLLRGAREIKASGADLIVMDPQYAPKVLVHPSAEELVGLIGEIAVEAGAALFRRFQLMKFWRDRHLGFDQFLSPDHLHMNDWSYACLAEALAFGMVRALHPVR